MATPSFQKVALAAASGITTCAAGAELSQMFEDTSGCPNFVSSFEGGTRYNLDTFQGRFKSLFYAYNPLLLLKSSEYCLEGAKELKALKDRHAKGEDVMAGITPEENLRLWKLKQEVNSAVHPDTGEIVPHPFRMSGYVPFNGPICVFQVTSSTTLPIVFWNWANQSQNALVNYFNRNAASAMSDETLMKSYTGAVVGAMTVAMGLATFVKKSFSPPAAARLLQFVTFPACVVASSMNCYIVRAPEMDVGVPILDEKGNDILPGKLSKVAATKGVYETTASRAFLQIPVYFVPPLITSFVPPIKAIITRTPALGVPITTYLLLVAFGIGLPGACAVFPKISSVGTEELEDEFKEEVERRGGAKIVFGGEGDKAWFDRGL
ncbi:hypothetical protein TrRE_jg10162 [Triparma retinervis]|uniref:Sidoreflexin n=1 Tax=Triparma retinervis TaxID=2557542 RepID=A0A9W7AMQ3_9STRA|nr:hypothetical protein TrRE_jg10162 [Triparma retinervis]